MATEAQRGQVECSGSYRWWVTEMGTELVPTALSGATEVDGQSAALPVCKEARPGRAPWGPAELPLRVRVLLASGKSLSLSELEFPLP